MVVLRDGDYMKNIIAYIEKNMARGYNIDQMRFTLLQHGYSRAAIDRGIRIYTQNHPVAAEMPKIEEPATARAVEPVVEEKKGLFSRMFGFFSK